MKDDEIILPVQRMFPNCRKYKKCCTDIDTKFLERSIHLKPKYMDYTLLTEKDTIKPPRDFEVIRKK